MSSIRTLVDDLAHEDQWQAAAEALVEVGGPAVHTLVAAFSFRDEHVRARSVIVLARIGTPAVSTLIGALRSVNTNISSAAVDALVAIGAPAVPALTTALSGYETPSRRNAARALRRIGPNASLAAQALGLALGRGDPVLRREALEALIAIGPAAVPVLIRAIWIRELNAQVEAASALARIGPPAVWALIAGLKIEQKWIRPNLIWALSQIGFPAIEPLTAALRDPERLVRLGAAEALGSAFESTSSSVEALSGALGDEDDEVRGAAVRAICCIGGRALARLEEQPNEADTERRSLCEHAIGAVLERGEWGVRMLTGLLRERGHGHHIGVRSPGQAGGTRSDAIAALCITSAHAPCGEQ